MRAGVPDGAPDGGREGGRDFSPAGMNPAAVRPADVSASAAPGTGSRLARALGRSEPWLAALIVIADQATKALVRANVPPHTSVEIVPGLLSLTHILNTGAAFGLMNAVDFPLKSVVVGALALIALGAIAFYAVRFGSETWLARHALALILAGAVGNLIDRATMGAVLDFVDVYWATWHFWAFNVADAAITAGAFLLILDMLRTGHDVPKAA
jgi:signal peptidase II